MKTINLNGYIDEEVWYGDEITPSMLPDALYGENNEFSDIAHILNSYGGSCNAPFGCTTSAPIRARCIW